MVINILTRCTRPQNLLTISKTIFSNLFEINWYILFDTNRVKDIDASLLMELTNLGAKIKFLKGESNGLGMNMINNTLDEICDGWVYILDDDNIIHPEFYNTLDEFIDDETYGVLVFNQKVDGKDFSKLDIREVKPENVKVGSIDSAQFLIHIDDYGDILRFNDTYVADGELIEKLFEEKKDDFIFIQKELCYYNYIGNYTNSSPKVLVLGIDEKLDLKSNHFGYESSNLNILQLKNDESIDKVLSTFNPDSIITIGENFSLFPNLCNKSLDFRKRWLHFNKIEDNLGDMSYKCANSYILDTSDTNTPLISFFTPIYNTGEKLWRTYESLRTQTYNNWEWCIVNDSTDSGFTLKIAESIAEQDCRVKLYDFRKKSDGIVGESKYRAAALCMGEYIMELDHDDILTNDAGYWMVEAFKRYPDAKFVYSDCAEIWENHSSITYGEGFAYGYGSYRDEVYNGITYKVMNTSNINPKTIRHIVGVPNHFRAWDRKFYMSIGGHNRRLTIADDYELIVRTFLKTKMVRIPKMLYLQFYHSNNTQDKTRADIQRRVRSIREFYNDKINQRFKDLGLKDWAYEHSPYNPLSCESKFGREENAANYIFSDEIKIQQNFDYSDNLQYIL
jgi:glycosyltransferase involved in cell wall biosynthesis